MNLVKRNKEVWFPSVFDEFLKPNFFSGFPSMGMMNVPAVNIRENEKEFVLEFAAPGLSKEDFKVEVHDDVLTVSSEKKSNQEKKEGEKYTRREFSYSSFSRSFSLPENVDDENIQANHKDGVLHIILPKQEVVVANGKKTIEING